MKILVAEHEPIWRDFLCCRLQARGFAPMPVGNGELAWATLQQKDAPRLAFINRTLPFLNALELCQRVRGLHDAFYTFLVVLMPNRYPWEELLVMEAGADDCLAKPITGDQLNVRLAIAQRVLAIDDRLSKLNGRWRTLLDSMPFGVASVDEEGQLKRMNTTFAVQMGFGSPKELIGTSLSQFLSNTTDSRGLLEEIQWQEPFNAVEVICRPRNGRLRPMRLWGRPLPKNDEAVYEIVTQEVV
jgi:PAS domain S-box-containing protein